MFPLLPGFHSEQNRTVPASVETSLFRKVAFAGIEDESESGSDSGRNGQDSEGSLSEVSSQYERSHLERYKVGLQMKYEN